MQIDVFDRLYIVKHSQGTFFKIIWYPMKEFKKKMAIGITAIDETEAHRLYQALKAYFENEQLPEYVRIKDMRGIAGTRARPIEKEIIDAEMIQKENMAAEVHPDDETPV